MYAHFEWRHLWRWFKGQATGHCPHAHGCAGLATRAGPGSAGPGSARHLALATRAGLGSAGPGNTRRTALATRAGLGNAGRTALAFATALALGLALALSPGCGGWIEVDDIPRACAGRRCPEGAACIEGAQGPSCQWVSALEGGLCAVGESGCEGSLICLGEEGARPGEAGRCGASAAPQCRIGDGRCNEGHVCVAETRTPYAPGRCLKEKAGEACTTDAACTPGTVCLSATCQWGERAGGGAVVATLHSFRLQQGGQLRMPLAVNGLRDERLKPDFIDRSLAATLRVETRGPVPSLALWADDMPLCATQPPLCTQGACTWTCLLPEGWAGTGAPRAVALRLALGASTQTWTYVASTLPEAEVPGVGGVFPGRALKVCATAPALHLDAWAFQPPLRGMEVETTRRGTQEVALAWRLSESGPGHICQEAQVPADWESGETLHLSIRADIADAEGNLRTTHARLHAPLLGLVCRHNLGLAQAAATAPLAMSAPRLLVGTSGHRPVGANLEESHNSLYVFEPSGCTPAGGGSLSRLYTGPIEGPMVVLADTQQVALSTRGGVGPPGRTLSRLALVDVAQTPPVFARAAADECAAGVALTLPTARFEQGLALLSPASPTSPWRLVAPANHSDRNQTRLMAYMPWAGTLAERCLSSTPVPSAFRAPLAHSGDGTVLGVWGSTGEGPGEAPGEGPIAQHWRFEPPTWAPGVGLPHPLQAPSFLALSDTRFWVSDTALRSAHAVDSQGRAYAVDYLGGLAWLTRYEADGTGYVRQADGFVGTAVGSPLLGEPLPGNAAEIYVVTTDGRIRAFHAHTLALLWTEALGIEVSAAAQPVLAAEPDGTGTLWLVGLRGEIRGLRTASHGLSRTAHWPTAFRDNCNSSNLQATPDNMPSCF